jgi:flagellar hook-length control protein FliK
MNALPPLPNLADLLASLLPAQTPATPQRVAGEAPAGTSFEAVLLDAQAQPRAELPAELTEIEDREAEPEAADPLAQSALALPAPAIAQPEPLENPDIATEPAEAEEPTADPAPLQLGPSLVNLVLGTAEGLRDAPRSEASSPERRMAPSPASTAAEQREHAPGASEFPRLEAATPSRESDPRTAPRHDDTPEPAPARIHAEPDAQAAAAREPAAAADPHAQRTAQADAALRAAQGNAASANTAPAVSEPGSARDAASASHAARALPELPARGELEVVRSVRVLADQGGGRVHIRLDPPELGGLSLRVIVSDGVVHVSMLADQAPVAELLQRHSSELRSALETHGLRLDQLDVGTGQADLGSRDAHPREAEERAATGPRGLARRFDPIALPMRRYDVSTLGAVDLHV